MKAYIEDIIPQLKAFSKKLEDLTILSKYHWVLVETDPEKQITFLFRKNNELLISTNGVLEDAVWEHLGNDSIKIRTEKSNKLLRLIFLDEKVLAFKMDSSEKQLVFVNWKYLNELSKPNDVYRYLNQTYPSKARNVKLDQSIMKILNNELLIKIIIALIVIAAISINIIYA